VQDRGYTERDEALTIERVAMKRVPAEEFQDRASEYLNARETLAIERDGRLIGHYVPVGDSTSWTNGAAESRKPTIVQGPRRV
jgi:hypothetical protein